MTEVIVYRNPLEAMIWNSMFNGGFAIFIAIVACALLGVAVYAMIEKIHIAMYYRKVMRGYTVFAAASFLDRHKGKISIAVSLVALYLMHLANIKGWL